MFKLEKKTLLAVVLFVGVWQVVAYYLAGALSGCNGDFAIAQPDTLFYCQAARRIVEGHPLSYSAGTAVSTGTTSHLYPFILAIPYALGATGEAFFRAGFALNALFYLVFLWGWCLVICELVRQPFARMVAGGLVVLLGHTAFATFAQSDIGFWLAVSAFFAAGLMRRDVRIYGPLLVLGPWVRPEGMICVVAFVGCVVARAVLNRVESVRRLPMVRRADWLFWGLGLVSMVGVFVFNYVLTGACQFSSVAHKGHFYLSNSFASGVVRTATDFVLIVKAYFLGLPQGDLRDFAFVPILGAALAWLGVFGFKGRERGDWRLVVWLVAIGGGVLTIASSGWQNTNYDRYLAWLLPTIAVAMGLGIEVLQEKWPAGGVARLAGGVVLLWTFGGAVAAFASFVRTSRTLAGVPSFVRECEAVMSERKAVGGNAASQVAYCFSDRRVAQLCGIYSPEFFDGRWPEGVLEILKNEPTTRFEYWLSDTHEQEVIGFKLEKNCGRQLLVGPNGLELLQTDWSRFDTAGQVPKSPQPRMSLKARVDVAYAKDERDAEYEILPRYAHVNFVGISKLGKLGTREIIESGRLVVGQDEMTIPTKPGRDLSIVMRTGDECKAFQDGEFGSTLRTYAFANPLKLNLQVDGVPAGMGEAQLATNAFSDVTFTIPGKFITKERSRIAFCGDHVAYAYWFYQ